jgi:hypothetical protein
MPVPSAFKIRMPGAKPCSRGTNPPRDQGGGLPMSPEVGNIGSTEHYGINIDIGGDRP